MKYQRSLIYYMSGTGNSYRTANWISDGAEIYGASSQVIPIEKHTQVSELGSGDLLGIVMPTHGFTAPWHVIRFVLGLPHTKGVNSLIVATRAGTRIGSIPFPGLEGTACYLIAILLLLKGYSIRGIMGLDMPSNWMSLHWGLSKANSEFIIGRAKQKINIFIKKVMIGKTAIGGIISLIIGLLILPISFGYLFVGRFYLAKLFFASYRCNGCGQCAKNCPVGAIRMLGKKQLRPYWTFNCESCMRCMGYCPKKAVEASQSFAVILYYVTVLPVSVYLLNKVSQAVPFGEAINTGAIQFLANYAYILVSIYLTYFVFSQLIKIRIINKIFTFTTLTHIYRRYHEPSTKLSDMSTKHRL